MRQSLTLGCAINSSLPRSRSLWRKLSATISTEGQGLAAGGAPSTVGIAVMEGGADGGAVKRCRRATMRPFNHPGAAPCQRAVPASSRPRKSNCQSSPPRVAPMRRSLNCRPKTSIVPTRRSTPVNGNESAPESSWRLTASQPSRSSVATSPRTHSPRPSASPSVVPSAKNARSVTAPAGVSRRCRFKRPSAP